MWLLIHVVINIFSTNWMIVRSSYSLIKIVALTLNGIIFNTEQATNDCLEQWGTILLMHIFFITSQLFNMPFMRHFKITVNVRCVMNSHCYKIEGKFTPWLQTIHTYFHCFISQLTLCFEMVWMYVWLCEFLYYCDHISFLNWPGIFCIIWWNILDGLFIGTLGYVYLTNFDCTIQRLIIVVESN